MFWRRGFLGIHGRWRVGRWGGEVRMEPGSPRHPEKTPLSRTPSKAVAFERFLMNLPDPASCVEWRRNHMSLPGALIIMPPDTQPNPWEIQSQQDLAAQRAHYTALRVEVLARLGF